MPLKPPKKVSTTANIADVSTDFTEDLKVAALFTVGSEGEVESTQTGLFLLNPNTIEENKKANWVQQTTPGNSDPVMQWLSSGPRTVSFDALVTADTSDFVSAAKKPGEEEDRSKLAKVFTGSIASAFAKTSTPPAPRLQRPGEENPSLDISNYLNYYRSLLYPVYDDLDNPRTLKKSPPLLVFLSGSSVNKFAAGGRITSNSDLWVLTDLIIRVTKQLPNLAPMEATVSFKLIQYNIRSFDRRRFLL